MVAMVDQLELAKSVAVKVTDWRAVTTDGAVYRPSAVTEPALAGVNVHATAVLAASATLLVNCWVWEGHTPRRNSRERFRSR